MHLISYSLLMKSATKLFKSVADETRLRILLLLTEHDELCVCDLMAALDLPQSTVSRHLAYLKNAGWLDDRRSGVWMRYSLASNRSPVQADILSTICVNLTSLPDHSLDQQRLATNFQEKNCS